MNQTPMLAPHQKHRSGTVLVVMIGISTILMGLILALGLRVKRSISDQSGFQKHAQAFMMAQAAAMYLNNAWDITNKSPEYLTGNNRILWDPVQPAAPAPAIPCTEFTAGLCANQAATRPIAGSLGWYHIRVVRASAGPPVIPNDFYCITAVGGASKGRNPSTIKPNNNPADYEARYYLTYDPVSFTFNTIPLQPSSVTGWITSDPLLMP